MHYRLRKVVRQLVELGDLSWMLDDHQEVCIYNHYREWETRRHKDKGANRIFMIDAARQTGKTHCSCIILSEDNLRQKQSRRLYGSATAIGLAEFVIPNLDTIYEQFPEDLRPMYSGRYKGTRAMYRFHNGSQLKLVGVDDDPKGLRGPKLHGFVLGEAGFIVKLKQVIGGALYPQMQRIPDATGILESSAPEDADHDFDMIFKPSCEARKAYVFMTIDDNTALSQETKDEYVDAAREIDPVDAEREYFGKRVRSAKLTVFPEFDREVHCVKEYELPKHGMVLTSYDPGQVHLFAISWSVFDYATDTVVFVDDWTEHNASTEKVAAITAARELDLFGTVPPTQLRRLSPNEWTDLLGDDRTANLADALHEAANKRYKDEQGRFPERIELSDYRWYDNDSQMWRYNPHLRVCDTSAQLINDMSTMFGLYLDPTTKDDLRTVMVQNVRSNLKRKRMLFLPRAANTASHVSACTWDKFRKKWILHSVWSHFDLAATVVYGMRYWDQYYHLNPFPPKHLGKRGDNWVGKVEVVEQPVSYGDHW